MEIPTASRPIPLVSVAMTAYNSAQWLPRSLDSVLLQRTEFPIEIVIGDDCSKDETIAVANSYRERHPDRIRVIERDKNVGIQRNYFETFEQCRGKYIAWLDADDLWTDPDKLSLQIAALEADDSINVCGHFVRWVDDTEHVTRERYPEMPAGRYGLSDILRRDFLPALSVVFRNGIHRQLPPWYFDLAPMTDWPIWILAALSGQILLLDRIMADYRITPGSAMISKGQLYWYQTDARFYEHIQSVLPHQWQQLARAEKGKRYESIAYLLRTQGDYIASRRAAIRAFKSPLPMDRIGAKTKSLFASIVHEVMWRFQGSKPSS